MILRLSTKLNAKIKAGPTASRPLDPNAYADWSGHLFTAERTQFVILTNTASLYSVVMYGQGLSNDSRFIDRSLSAMREFMASDGLEFVYLRLIAPTTGTVSFAKAFNRSVTGSMNDLVYHAKMWVTEGGLSPFEAALRLNDIPFSSLDYRKPREVFRSLDVGQGVSDRNGK